MDTLAVGIDITASIYQRGVSRYTTNLVRSLAMQNSVTPWLYGSSFRQKKELTKIAHSLGVPSNRIFLQSYPSKLYSFFWQLGLNTGQDFFKHIQVFHAWDWIQPDLKQIPLVSTIHDLALLHFPEQAHPEILAKHQASWKRLKQKQAQLIAVSQTTKQDLINLLNYPAQKIQVIHEALPEETRIAAEQLTEESIERIKEKFSLTRPFILFVGTQEPRKNLKRLIAAWEPLSKDIDLIIAGAQGWEDFSQLTKLPRFLGQVSNRELAALYGEAELLAFPSLYEGFGLPILEAFYHGTPVVTANVAAMPEVAGNAAVLVDPLSVESIRSGIQTILSETQQQQKERLQKMIIRLHMFSWTKVARETAAAYHTAYQAFQ